MICVYYDAINGLWMSLTNSYFFIVLLVSCFLPYKNQCIQILIWEMNKLVRICWGLDLCLIVVPGRTKLQTSRWQQPSSDWFSTYVWVGGKYIVSYHLDWSPPCLIVSLSFSWTVSLGNSWNYLRFLVTSLWSRPRLNLLLETWSRSLRGVTRLVCTKCIASWSFKNVLRKILEVDVGAEPWSINSTNLFSVKILIAVPLVAICLMNDGLSVGSAHSKIVTGTTGLPHGGQGLTFTTISERPLQLLKISTTDTRLITSFAIFGGWCWQTTGRSGLGCRGESVQILKTDCP